MVVNSATMYLCFNPRSRMGSDILSSLMQYRCKMFQSTLPHGERRHSKLGNPTPPPFQSTLPHGERLPKPAYFTTEQSFNPRSRMGSDWVTSSQIICPTCFNPRSRMGSDQDCIQDQHPRWVSIHAPAWGATCRDRRNVPVNNVSIHAPAWGATLYRQR